MGLVFDLNSKEPSFKVSNKPVSTSSLLMILFVAVSLKTINRLCCAARNLLSQPATGLIVLFFEFFIQPNEFFKESPMNTNVESQ